MNITREEASFLLWSLIKANRTLSPREKSLHDRLGAFVFSQPETTRQAEAESVRFTEQAPNPQASDKEQQENLALNALQVILRCVDGDGSLWSPNTMAMKLDIVKSYCVAVLSSERCKGKAQ